LLQANFSFVCFVFLTTTMSTTSATEQALNITLNDVKAAAERIKGVAHRTPVLTCSALDGLAGSELYFKCENFQKVGAFKFRGAYNSVSKLADEEVKKGVVTHSSGNHAQALALAAKLKGVPAYIVMPEGAPKVKKNAVIGYGAKVIECANNLQAREDTANKVVQETGATFIHPYDYQPVIEGQGTAGLELLEEVSDLDVIVAPVGGGGLLSGICVAAKGINPNIKIIAGEPKGADDAYRSMQAGVLIPQTNPVTIADGLKTSVGNLNWAIIQQNVERIITVSEEEIKKAMKLIWERMKIVVEPSGAVPFAAILSDEFRSYGFKKVGIVLSGGNVDLDDWKWT
jgi:threonine dehydratase